MEQNKTGKYFKYAIGEIALVVIGILIALNINNWNERRNARQLELGYLKNIQADLHAELKNNIVEIDLRKIKVAHANRLLTAPAGKSKEEQLELDLMRHIVYGWQNFIPSNNTFKEMLSSGKLGTISNDSIKYYLLELDKEYTAIAGQEHHMRREFEQYLYDVAVPNTSVMNIYNIAETAKKGTPINTNTEQLSDQQFIKLQREHEWLRNNQAHQNGLKLSILNNLGVIYSHHELTKYINKLDRLIAEEGKKG